MTELACYIHIPFCMHKCIYCDFYSIIKFDNVENYVNALLKEINYYSNQLNNKYKLKTIFFGGGTPSILEPKNISLILDTLHKNFLIDSDIEITLEANPGTLNKQKLKEIKSCGVNRLSVGVQSFNKNDLNYLTRIHSAKQAKTIIENAYNIGFTNLSLDLIFNLPKQTKKKWLKNLKTAISLPISHISAYSLIVEPGTILNKHVLDGKVKINDEDYDADLYQLTIDFLENAGFYQYEVSNFAKPGFQSEHNKFYWEYKDYLGLGPSAHSFIDGIRWHNYSSLNYYLMNINQKGEAKKSVEILTQKQKTEELIITGLRATGINLKKLHNISTTWFNDNLKTLKFLENKGYITITADTIKLTKAGYPLCDEILLNLNY